MTGTLGILGTGLIGGSIGKAARERGWYVLGYDVSLEALDAAQTIGAIDERTTREGIYERCDVVAIAAHVNATIDEVRSVERARPVRPRLIFDVSSVKGPVAAVARDIANFVPSHPMAGSEKAGATHASAAMFSGRAWAYVPAADERANAAMRAFAISVGATPVIVDPAEHDRAVALTSHLPQVLATCFASQFRARGDGGASVLCGPAARELLRLGGSPSTIWRDIYAANAQNLERELRLLAIALESVADGLAAGGPLAASGRPL